jgi:hypothetical protein
MEEAIAPAPSAIVAESRLTPLDTVPSVFMVSSTSLLSLSDSSSSFEKLVIVRYTSLIAVLISSNDVSK